MKLIALMPVRNEDWILGLSLRVALLWCDEVCVLNHASTDATAAILREIACEHPGRVWIDEEPDPLWDEMQHRQRLLESARRRDATHIVIVDADEVLTANLISRIRLLLEPMPRNSILQLPGYNLRGGTGRYHSNGIWGHRWFSTAFVDSPTLGWKGDTFHSREPSPGTFAPYRPVSQGTGGVLHYWGADEHRLRAKHALYKVTERIRWPDKSIKEIDRLYSWFITGTGPTDCPATWIYSRVPELWTDWPDITVHPEITAPWQEEAVRSAVRVHGAETFKGLDLFGIA